MLNEKYTKKIKFLINIVYILALLGLAYVFLKFIFFWTLPFLIAFGVCMLAEPLVKVFTNRLKWKRSLASALVITLFLLVLLALTALLSTTVFKEVKGLFFNLDRYLDSFVSFIGNIPDKYEHLFEGRLSALLRDFASFLKDYDYSGLLSGSLGSGVLKYAGSFVSSLPSALVFTIVTIVATFFTSISLPSIKEFILRQFPQKTRELIISTKNIFISTIIKYLKSYFVLMMITFAELSVAFLIIGIKPAVTLAFLISIVDILPILGVGTVLIPWAVIELLLGNPIRALIVAGVYLIVTVVRQTLEPKIIGDHVGLPPIVTLFCIYVGLQLFGVLGMFLLPITVIIMKNLQETGKIQIWK